MCMTPEAYEGSALRGGSTPWGISDHTTSPPVFPSTIMGDTYHNNLKDEVVVVSVPHDGGWEDWWRGGMGDTYHNNLILVCATGVSSPPEVTSSPSATWRVVCGCCPYEGLGHWLGVGGSLGIL